MDQFIHIGKSAYHYHGDMVRRLFLAGAIIMLLTLPFLNELLPVPAFVSVFVILAVGFVAGLTNPTQKMIAILNALIAMAALAVFEYYAVDAYFNYSAVSPLFWTNQILALNFFFALYYSSKTLRGMILSK